MTREEIEEKMREAAEEIKPLVTTLVEALCEAHQKGYLAGVELGLNIGHPQWIPVEERLPEKDNEFEDYSKLVIVTNGKDFWKGMYNYGGEEWLTFDLWRIDDATHWMEIVPPRKEE